MDQISAAAVDVISAYIAERASGHVFLHAGVVVVNDRALVLPASTRCGKSTLVRALLQRGASYMSDEFAPVDQRGLIAPFPRPLSLRNPEGPPTIAVAESFGAATITKSLPIGAVFLTRYEESSRWQPTRVDPAEAVLRMTEHAVAARTAPDRVLRTLKTIATNAPVFRSPRPDVETSADAILDSFRRLAGS